MLTDILHIASAISDPMSDCGSLLPDGGMDASGVWVHRVACYLCLSQKMHTRIHNDEVYAPLILFACTAGRPCWILSASEEDSMLQLMIS